MSRREEQIKKILEHQEEKFKKEMEERDQDLLKSCSLAMNHSTTISMIEILNS